MPTAKGGERLHHEMLVLKAEHNVFEESERVPPGPISDGSSHQGGPAGHRWPTRDMDKREEERGFVSLREPCLGDSGSTSQTRLWRSDRIHLEDTLGVAKSIGTTR